MSTTEQTFQSLPIAFIRISKTNRKRFNQQALIELADNIKANGLIQPILVRPVPQTETEPEPFEIVCGERRYRASKIAGLESINVICRELSDTQAAELQLIENLQREDPHPMEEAEGYQALMLHSGYTAEMLAEKLNKSKSQIYATLKLCNLCKELRDAFFENKKFSRSLALLVARIPVPELQVEAYNEIIDEYDGEPMSYRDAADHIQMHYNVNLKTAIFSTTDSKLVPEAGACKTCPKRTDNDPDLADFEKNICIDPKCYENKVIAHHAQVITKAEKNKLTILRDKDAKSALAAALNCVESYASDQTKLWEFERLKNHTDGYKTFISAVGSDKLPEAIAIAVVNDIPAKLYDLGVAQSMLEDLGFCYTELEEENKKLDKQMRDSDSNGEDNEDDEESETDTDTLDRSSKADELNRQVDNEEIKRMRIYRAVRNRAPLSIGSLRLFVRDLENSYSHNIPAEYHEELYGRSMDTPEERLAYIDSATSEQLQLLIIDYVVGYSIQKPKWSDYSKQKYVNREDDEFSLLLDVAASEGIEIAIAEQETATPAQTIATEVSEPEVAAEAAQKKRGRPSKAYQAILDAKKAATTLDSNPTPGEKWPFPTPKKTSDES